MRIQHNIMAMSAYRNYTNNVSAMKKNLEKLSSGYKINRAGDDAAGLAISEKMRAQITGLETAQKNAKDGISLVQTAEGALTEVHDMLNRMVELATQSANGTYDNTTDRAQMQKEVDQLLDEINRIADSSNFNGIKLLDGSLGLNQSAFQIAQGDKFSAAVNAQPLDLVQTGIIGSTATAAGYHGDKSVTGQAPQFVVDLKDLKFKASASSTSVSFTISVGSWSITATATGVATGGIASIGKIMTAIASAIASQGTVASGTGTFKIGGLVMKASAAANGKITFTYYAAASTATKAGSWATDMTGSTGASAAAAFNAAVFGSGKGKITITASTGQINGGKQWFCDITSTKNAVAQKDADRPGIDLNLANVVKDGYSLTIDGKKYVFKTVASNSLADDVTDADTIIDVSMVAASKQAQQAALIMAGSAAQNSSNKPNGNAAGVEQTAGSFTISLKGDTTIHIDITNASKGSKADDFEKMKKLISATDAGKRAQAANTKLTLKDANAIVKGDTITIANGSVTTKYVFADGTDVTTGSNQVKYLGDDKSRWTAADVANAIGANAKVSGNTITISAQTASASAAAPMILGRGLTLQIGDTADSFNQLNVAVQDMHAANLGIGGLQISDEVSAQQAIDKIKSAINTVSDVRGTLGATQNRLDHTINNLSVMTENIQDAESTIRDVDVAEEMMAYTKNNILIQSAQAMLAQANQVPQGVLQLLQ